MRFAISTDGGFVSAHFGRCPSFTIIDIEKNTVAKTERINNPGHHPGYLPEFLHQKGVHCIICGGMGERALSLFKNNGIEAMVGINGKISDVIEKLLKGDIQQGKSLCKRGRVKTTE
jgi:predicted Fe-Mo cluster-binding NifX family protein